MSIGVTIWGLKGDGGVNEQTATRTKPWPEIQSDRYMYLIQSVHHIGNRKNGMLEKHRSVYQKTI